MAQLAQSISQLIITTITGRGPPQTLVSILEIIEHVSHMINYL
jgi:hypothetical protein